MRSNTDSGSRRPWPSHSRRRGSRLGLAGLLLAAALVAAGPAAGQTTQATTTTTTTGVPGAPVGSSSTSTATILPGGKASIPADAPYLIVRAIQAANRIHRKTYIWGGGHRGFKARGYDCSGAVSYALAGGGMVRAPMTSGQFMSWGAPGPGEWLTIYASPSHVYVVIGGLRWDTVGDARGSGPRWHPFDAYPSGFAVRHFPGL